MKNIAIILVLLLAVGTIVFLLSDDNSKGLSESPQLDKEMAFAESAVDTPSTFLSGERAEYEELTFPDNTLDASDWKTYRNEEFGFAVKYPESWLIVVEDTKNSTPFDTTSDGCAQSGWCGEVRLFPDGVMSANSIILMRISNISLKDHVGRLENNELFQINVEKYIEVNNTVGIKTPDFEGPGFWVYEKYILEGQDTITYEFGGLNEPNAKNYKATLEQMLLSFKLIE